MTFRMILATEAPKPAYSTDLCCAFYSGSLASHNLPQIKICKINIASPAATTIDQQHRKKMIPTMIVIPTTGHPSVVSSKNQFNCYKCMNRWETEEECTTLCPPNCPQRQRYSSDTRRSAAATRKQKIKRVVSESSRDSIPRRPQRSGSGRVPSRWATDC